MNPTERFFFFFLLFLLLLLLWRIIYSNCLTPNGRSIWTNPEFGSDSFFFFPPHLRLKRGGGTRWREKFMYLAVFWQIRGRARSHLPSPALRQQYPPSSVHLIKIHLIWIFFANMVWLLAMTWNIPVCYFNHTHPNGQRYMMAVTLNSSAAWPHFKSARHF